MKVNSFKHLPWLRRADPLLMSWGMLRFLLCHSLKGVFPSLTLSTLLQPCLHTSFLPCDSAGEGLGDSSVLASVTDSAGFHTVGTEFVPRDRVILTHFVIFLLRV